MSSINIENEIRRVLRIEADSIGTLSQTLDYGELTKAVHAISSCSGKIVASGCGTSGAACKKIVHSLCCIERPAVFLSPADAVHGALGILQGDDILILVSKGGSTQELVQLLHARKVKKATLIAVTENPDSILAREADIPIIVKVKSEPCRFNMLATASTLAVISTFDAICIAVMQLTDYSREQFALIHPGGAVGERLLSK